jgi:hypothetical protein
VTKSQYTWLIVVLYAYQLILTWNLHSTCSLLDSLNRQAAVTNQWLEMMYERGR